MMRLAAGSLAALVCCVTLADESAQRTLTFEDRVKAQGSIERVYYAHQIGAVAAFESAVPRSVLESKVRKYLEQTEALAAYWKITVTDEMLQGELERMAHGTRMPERLLELYAALGNDAFVIKECLARATLVGRLARDSYAFDPILHEEARLRAEALLGRLRTGELSPLADAPERSVIDFAFDESPRKGPPRRRASLSLAELHNRRAQYPDAVGQVSALAEERDQFLFSVVLSESPRAFRVARYAVPKVSWDTWWQRARTATQSAAVAAVASDRAPLPLPSKATISMVAPGFVCTDGGPAAANAVSMTCGGPIDGNTERVDVVLGGPTSGSTTLRGLSFDLTYNPLTLEFVPEATYTSPLFSPDAVISVTQLIGQPGRVLVSIQELGTIVDPVSVVAGQHTVLSLSFRRRSWLSFGPSPLAFENANAVSASTAISFTSPLALYYETCPPEDSWRATSLSDAPSARYLHTAVWTGSLMVIWGGSVGTDVNTGARYDPTTDTWTPTSTVGAPSGREYHTAVWTGSVMVVWGGWDGGAEVTTGGRYDPATDSWTPTSTTDAPSARESHTAVWTGSVMVVWGGYFFDGSAQFPSTGGRYDPTSDSWTPTSTVGVPTARYTHSAVWTGSVMVVWGGDFLDSSDHFLNSGGRYNPSTDTWTPTSTAAAPSARGGHTALWAGSVMIVWGGDFYDGVDHFTNTGGRYDPTTDSWTSTSTAGAPAARDFHTAAWTGNRMVVWGGYFYDGSDHVLDTGGRYDPITDGWSPTSTTDVPAARVGHTAVSTGSLMLVWGGIDSNFIYFSGGRYALSTSDGDGDGYSECAGDCDESNPAVHPGASDVCNGIDDDCDGAIDFGADVFCADGNACTNDACNGASGCTHVNNTGACDDGNACTVDDTCSDGACVGGPKPNCDDANLCTDDSCDSASGCVHTDNSASCTDGNVCTADACDPASGCSTIHKPVNIDTESFSADRVDGRDLVLLANAWSSCSPDVRYNAAADLDPLSTPPGACVDEADFHLFMNAFGQSCPL